MATVRHIPWPDEPSFKPRPYTTSNPVEPSLTRNRAAVMYLNPTQGADAASHRISACFLQCVWSCMHASTN
eukprot:34329-Eustigmatos_ZCMA.PRE.1